MVYCWRKLNLTYLDSKDKSSVKSFYCSPVDISNTLSETFHPSIIPNKKKKNSKNSISLKSSFKKWTIFFFFLHPSSHKMVLQILWTRTSKIIFFQNDLWYIWERDLYIVPKQPPKKFSIYSLTNLVVLETKKNVFL